MTSKPEVLVAYCKDVVPCLHDILVQNFNVHYCNSVVDREELINALHGKVALITGSTVKILIDGDLVTRSGGTLRVLAYISSDLDYVNVNELVTLGVKIGTSEPAYTEAISEHAVLLLLAVARNTFHIAADYKSTGTLPSSKSCCEYQQGLENACVGVIGAGKIGIGVAQKVTCFKISSLYYYSASTNSEMEDYGGELKKLEEIMKKCDFIAICLDLADETMGLISKHMINLMKRNAVLVNIGRSEVIDQDALIEALQSQSIRGAALDVTSPTPLPTDHPLFQLNNVIVTPHVGYMTLECFRQIATLAAENICAVIDGTPMPSPVTE